MFKKGYLIILIFIVLSCQKNDEILNAIVLNQDYLEQGWGFQRLGTDTRALYYTEENANYWAYSFDVSELNRGEVINITGVFANAHYISYNFYNKTTQDVLHSIYDKNIRPKTGAHPIRLKEDEYTLQIGKIGANFTAENYYEIPANVDEISIALRYYLPEGDDFGEVDLPKITTINTDTNLVVDSPPATDNQDGPLYEVTVTAVRASLAHLFNTLNTDGNLKSYRIGGNNNVLANNDNEYIQTSFNYDANQVAVLRFLPLKAATDFYDDDAGVRYWSLSYGDDASRNQFSTYHDEHKVADDGYVYVAIANENLKDKLNLNEKWNFEVWPENKNCAVLYRNLLTTTNNPFHMRDIPAVNFFFPNPNNSADRHIGDYAPQGKIISKTDFLTRGMAAVW